MLLASLFAAVLAACCLAHMVENIDSIKVQNEVRKHPRESMVDNILRELTTEETDFLAENLKQLHGFQGSECEQCHNKMRHARTILDQNPDKSHLIALMLYKYCLDLNNNKDKKCNLIDFFIFTNTFNSEGKTAASGPIDAFNSATSISFYDNDFIQLIKHMNISSNLTLDYYCHYKGKHCDLPVTPNVTLLFDLDSWWPPKQVQHEKEPEYTSKGNVFNVLHISDFHNQLRYQLGAEANCSTGVCCLPESHNDELTTWTYNFTDVYSSIGASNLSMSLGFYDDAHYTEDNTYVEGEYHDFPKIRGWNWVWTPASTFGNYQCDPPEVLLNNSLLNIGNSVDEKKYEFALFTGDIVDHDKTHCDANVTKFAEERSFKIMKHFLDQVPIYPTLGNHDTFPYGQLAPHHLNNVTFDESTYHWNQQELAELWVENGWFNESEKEGISQHYAGFSTTTARGLKVISLNSNCYYQKNLYAFIDVENEPDLFGQWKFLIDELVESEKNNQRVWILAHVPTGDGDALPIQSNIFAKIVERFSPYTIANIFFGHTHKDQFKILHNEKTGEPINMAWISQAITPLGPANPSWRYYEVEDESFSIINAHHYYTPLNETWVNGPREPAWKYEYSPREAYDPNSTWPLDAPLNATFWHQFVLTKLADDKNLDFHQRYTDYMYRANPYVPDCRKRKKSSRVSEDCMAENYCYNVAFRVDDYKKCTKDI